MPPASFPKCPSSQVTWGHPLYGGDSRSAQTQLVRVQKVHAAETAFAAIRDDGSVVTWGHPEYGGVSAAVQDRLRYLTYLEVATPTRWSDVADVVHIFLNEVESSAIQ